MTSRPDHIHIFDSGSSALGLGLLPWAAAEWAQKHNWSARQIMEQLPKLKEQLRMYFVVDTLEYLHKGGRIGGAAAFFGSLLQIKPILYFNQEDYIDVYDKVRSRGRARHRVEDELNRALESGKQYRIVVMHVSFPEEGAIIYNELRERLPEHEFRLMEVGPVVATHTGPGTFGLAFHPWPFLD